MTNIRQKIKERKSHELDDQDLEHLKKDVEIEDNLLKK